MPALLHIISSMNPLHGGLSQAVYNMYRPLQKLGISNEVLCLDDPDEPFIRNAEYPVIALGKSVSPWQYNDELYHWLSEHLSTYQTILVHGLWLYHGNAVAKAIRALKKHSKLTFIPRVFVMPHGMLDPYFQVAESRRMKAIRNKLYWKLIEERVIREADGILFTCHEEMRLAATTFSPYRPRNTFNVGLGILAPPAFDALIMPDAFERACPQVNHQPYLLFLSRIHPKKGVDLLLEAYRQILEGAKDVNEVPLLVIAGPGLDTPYGKQCLSVVQSTVLLHKHIFFPGMLSGDAKWVALYGCDAFILPSHQENFGIAVVEAMACGKAVLISNQVNIYREIEGAKGGIISTNDVDGVKKQLQKWLQMTPVQKAVMGKNAFAAYQQYFTVEGAAEQLIAAFHF